VRCPCGGSNWSRRSTQPSSCARAVTHDWWRAVICGKRPACAALRATALVQTPILSAMWNDIGKRIQSATNLQIRIEAQFAPELIREALKEAMAHLDAVLRARDA
jgi:hypothetical protein